MIHERRPDMNTETNKQIARSFLQSVDDVDFEAWRAIAVARSRRERQRGRRHEP